MERETKSDAIGLGLAYLGVLLITIWMWPQASAMYAGETMTFEINLTDPVYTVVGNSSNLTGLNITFDGGNITISPAINYKPDNFTLIFFDNLTKEVEKIINRGGGGSRTKYVDRNVTVYVPEYIDTTETVEVEVEVEKIVEKIIYNDDGFKLWELLLLGVVGLAFGAWMMYNSKRKDQEPTAEEIMEEITYGEMQEV